MLILGTQMFIFEEKYKLGKMVEELHFGRCCWFGGCGYTLETLSKAPRNFLKV